VQLRTATRAIPKYILNALNQVWWELIKIAEDLLQFQNNGPKGCVGLCAPDDRIKESDIMESDLIQAYERRMRRFNLAVIVSALVALTIMFSVLWRFLY
jgi:hypothetical protein